MKTSLSYFNIPSVLNSLPLKVPAFSALAKSFYLLFLLLVPKFVEAYEINDGHIHYNEDMWSKIPPAKVIRYLSDNKINRAVVSSTPSEGTEKLYRLAPERIIPFLRPYRNDRDRYTYFADPTIIPYLEKKIASGIYKGIGEFHLFSENKNTQVAKQIMQLAADHELAISAHSDYETILALLDYQPAVRVIWAHCGMDHPVEDIKTALQQYPNLYCELSFRYNMFDDDDILLPEWKILLESNADRFILGMDTYMPRRWANLPEHVDFAQTWLEQLSLETRQQIASENINLWFRPAAVN